MTYTSEQLGKKESAMRATCTIYWWNFGKKQLDFQGEMLDFMKQKGFKIRTITHPRNKDVKGKQFTFSVSSADIQLRSYEQNHSEAAFHAIRLYLTILGDKAQIIGMGKKRLINWR